jgi:hypothetical protein
MVIMNSEFWRFGVFILITFVVFMAILRFVTQQRSESVSLPLSFGIALIVVVGGMLFAKLGQNAGWAWYIYYTVPALCTLLLPPLALQFSTREVWQYLILAFLSSPVIHVLFSFFLGWHEYMPFIRVPSLQELLTRS